MDRDKRRRMWAAIFRKAQVKLMAMTPAERNALLRAGLNRIEASMSPEGRKGLKRLSNAWDEAGENFRRIVKEGPKKPD